MKKVLSILAVFAIYNINAQASSGGGDLNQSGVMADMASFDAGFSGGFVVKNANRRVVEGTYYLYDEWNNTSVIYTSDEQQFLLRNINLNLKTNAFESQIDKDNVYIFNFNNIDRFVINNKVFKNYYWDDDNRVYQVIYESEDFQVLKGYKVVLVEGSANPMLSRKNDRYIKKNYYFIRENDQIKRFKLKKNKILKLIDDSKVDDVVNFAKTNKLSFSKEMDIPKILEYAGKN